MMHGENGRSEIGSVSRIDPEGEAIRDPDGYIPRSLHRGGSLTDFTGRIDKD